MFRFLTATVTLALLASTGSRGSHAALPGPRPRAARDRGGPGGATRRQGECRGGRRGRPAARVRAAGRGHLSRPIYGAIGKAVASARFGASSAGLHCRRRCETMTRVYWWMVTLGPR